MYFRDATDLECSLVKVVTTKDILELATSHLEALSGHVFDLLEINKPISPEAAVNLSKIVSKLSPVLGNLIEFNTIALLNKKDDFKGIGSWRRQDPGFPDAVFDGVSPVPGFELKAWCPLATEITARFKDSQEYFVDDNTYVCLIAWLPQFIVFGKPYILDVAVVSGKTIAKSRDDHYHNPPDYLVLEPEDTKNRTQNLQQSNTSGHKLQATDPIALAQAKKEVGTWGKDGKNYSTSANYQAQLRQLMRSHNYRLDTNYAKLDRIVHSDIEHFKRRVLNTKVHEIPVKEWATLIRGKDDARIRKVLQEKLDIKEGDPEQLLE
jgi:hypothetical protein